ncbi:MAG: hypothetical protein ACI4WG_04685 [Erysipelotrichaceae bacterium]
MITLLFSVVFASIKISLALPLLIIKAAFAFPVKILKTMGKILWWFLALFLIGI